jgi:hypothetical protein
MTYDSDHRPERDAEDAALPVFDASEGCAKCGATDLYAPDGAPLLRHMVEYVEAADMLRITCGRCLFGWARRPIDDQPCGTARVFDVAVGDDPLDNGRRYCLLRNGHKIPHEFTSKDNPHGGLPW